MNDLIKLLVEVARLANINISSENIVFMDRGCPHIPKGLPDGKMGIYMFEYKDIYLKIGKAGPKSDARFRSQHYQPNRSQSNLAKSILNDPDMMGLVNNKHQIDHWIKENVRRVDILIDSSISIFVLDLFESFLHCKFKPKYEGFKNQR